MTTKAIASVGLRTDELDQLLLNRGWIAVDRAGEYAMYDWPPSAPDVNHDVTYLIVDVTGRYQLPPYRVSRVDGEPVMYDTVSELVGALDVIETSRCGCKHRGVLK